jgi:hypothetical protein
VYLSLPLLRTLLTTQCFLLICCCRFRSSTRGRCWDAAKLAAWKALVRAATHPSQLLQAIRLVQAVLVESCVGAKFRRLRNARTCQTLAFAALEFYTLDSVISYSNAVDGSAGRMFDPMQEVCKPFRPLSLSDQTDGAPQFMVKRSVV